MNDSAAIAQWLADLAAEGPLTASRVVEAAADPGSPAHDRFEWDDARAAHEHRLATARKLIVSVRYVPSGASRSLPVFVHVPAARGEGEYAPVEIVVHQPERWELARREVLRQLDGARANLDDLDEALRVHGLAPTPPSVARRLTLARDELVALAPNARRRRRNPVPVEG